jgi:hypothetical protein
MLPKTLKYGSKIESAPCKSYRSNIPPQNGSGTYGFGDTIIVNIPTRQNLVLCAQESYLKFNCAFTNGASAANNLRWDSCGAHSLIQRIRIFHGSNLLSDIDSYGLLAKIMFDLQVSTDASQGKFNILAGTRSDLVSNLTTNDTAVATDAASVIVLANGLKTSWNAGKGVSALQINTGDIISSSLAATTDSATGTFCLNLISLLGTLSSQYIPLFACTSAPLRMEIQLVDSAVKCIASLTNITALKITNCEYVANFIELSDQAMSIVQSSLQGQPLQFVVPDYRNYQYSFALPNGTQTQVQMPIPAKFSSLKSLVLTARDQGVGVLTYFPLSSVTNGISDYTFRVGSVLMPPKAPSTLPEMFSEVIKAVNSMSNLDHQPSIEKYTYSMASSVAHTANGNTNSGSFYIGLDLENYPNAQKDSIFAGYNSNTDDIYAIMNFTSPAATTTRFDAFANFDCVVVFENNTAFVRY